MKSWNPQYKTLDHWRGIVALAQAVKDLLCDPERLIAAKTASLQAAQAQFCWEKQRRILLETAELALKYQ